MFTIKRTYLGLVYPVSILYVDSLNTTYSFENITIQADNDTDELTVQSGATCVFVGDGFPLTGSSYTTAVTGTLTISVTGDLSYGLHRYRFYTSLPLYPVAGLLMNGEGVFGLKSYLKTVIPTQIQVQHFPIPGVTESPVKTTITATP